MTQSLSNQLILLHEKDNVLVCGRNVRRGDILTIDGVSIVARTDVDVGHKLARVDLTPGDTVLKYGAPIGSVTHPTRIGGHVHSHNMKSDYIAATTRQATDKEVNI